MSVTIHDVLELPCMKNALVLGGRNGLNKIVTSISVLEYQEVSKQQELLLNDMDFSGNELVITAFSQVKDDVEAQCINIRRMAKVGEVGVIIYYVGLLIPQIDQKLIEIADELNIPLICMPKSSIPARYSELITEVMSAIFKDQMSSPYFVGEILDQVSLLPDHQRSVNTVLRILSDRLRSSFLLTDTNIRIINDAYWPRGQSTDYVSMIIDQHFETDGEQKIDLSQEGKSLFLYCNSISGANSCGMNLYIIRDNEHLSEEEVHQAVVSVQLAINLWSRQHEEIGISELVRAILMDEPAKMHRLASIFHIDIESVHTMWIIQNKNEKNKGFHQKAKKLADSLLSGYCKTAFSDYHDGYLILFMSWPFSWQENRQLADDFCNQLSKLGITVTITLASSLTSTAAVRHAFIVNKYHLEDTKHIFPGRSSYTMQEVLFAEECHNIVKRGEQAVNEKTSVLSPLEQDGEEELFLQTLYTYLLDSDCSITKTSERLYVHKNTIKYRINRICERLGYPVNKNPEQFNLYQACALNRLLHK